MSIKCVVCQDDHQIKLLKAKISELTIKLSMYEHSEMKAYSHEKQLIDIIYEQSDTPLLNEDFNIEGYQFVTLTYDPKKFGYMQSARGQTEYFLAALIKYEQLLYGCFEYHKNGNVHMHFIIKGTNEELEQMKKDIRYKFTDNPRNRDFMDYGICKDKTGIRYINKESNKYIKRRNV